MTKVLMLGIDALDSILLSKFERDLPNLRKLKEESPNIKSMSVQPPDSDTAWASIYTGLNPAKHGVVRFIDALDKASVHLSEEIDSSSLRGNTFWDFASKRGKKVCVILPHLGYPVWPVNGIMVGRASTKEDVQAYPESISDKYQLSHLNVIKGFPGRRKFFNEYIESHKKLISNEAEFGLKILKEYDWDLFFIYSSSLDMIQHNFWNYCDENDPTYPGDNPYKDVIRDFYKVYDKITGKFISAVDTNTTIIVLSDHGHGMRPVKLFNINEVLRRKGFLVSKVKKLNPTTYLIEKMKGRILDFISMHGLGNMAAKLLRRFPAGKKIYTSPLSIDWGNTLAYTSDLSGIKAYTYGGIIIEKENIMNRDYEELRTLIIKELSEFKDPNIGEKKKIVKWVRRREELYSGEYISKYPDIVFDLIEGYGAGWAINDSIISTSHSHNLVPGSHKAYSPVFLISNLEKDCIKKNITLMDVAPTVLDILGIKRKFGFDGESIFREDEREEI
jgi:predicted AlkP superfamily phosphohydrolase/phosphomutase